MKLIITIGLDGNDFEESDFQRALTESLADGATLNVEIARSISEEESEVARVFSLPPCSYFGVEIQKEEGDA